MAGRASLYTRDIEDEIIARISEGETLRSICRSERLENKDWPSEAAFRLWVVNDEPKGIAARYASARVAQCDAWADDILSISDDSSNDIKCVERRGVEIEVTDHEVVNRSRLKVDTRKWLMAKLHPAKYSEKAEVKLEAGDSLTQLLTEIRTTPPGQ